MKIKRFLKYFDLTELSNEDMYVIVNGSNHMIVLDNDEIAEHILSLIPLIGEEKK